jgi:hypothetical protein
MKANTKFDCLLLKVYNRGNTEIRDSALSADGVRSKSGFFVSDFRKIKNN